MIVGIGASQQISSDDLYILTAVMNRLLVRNEIHESDVFAAMIEKPVRSFSDVLSIEKANPLLEMKQQLDRQYEPDLSQRINRLLISRSLGPAISDVRIEMLDGRVENIVRRPAVV